MTATRARRGGAPDDATIGFIGGGNMARAMIGGLLASKVPPARIHVSEPHSDTRDALAGDFAGIHTGTSNNAIVRCDVCVLAVKPQVLKPVCLALAGTAAGARPLFVSIAAGVRIADIERWLGNNQAVVRAMPNQGALVGHSATGAWANRHCSEEQRALAGHVLGSIGTTSWFDDEADLDSVTAIAGSGPAYFFLLMEMLADAAREFGLGEPAARALVSETATAAALLAADPKASPAALRASVTSPGGTTAAAIDYLTAHGIHATFRSALVAARTRAGELADAANKD